MTYLLLEIRWPLHWDTTTFADPAEARAAAEEIAEDYDLFCHPGCPVEPTPDDPIVWMPQDPMNRRTVVLFALEVSKC